MSEREGVGRKIDHAAAAGRFNRDAERTGWHDQSLWFVRKKRDKAAAAVENWEELREIASRIKEHTLAHLADYLEELETNALNNGIVVHWAPDADAHNRIVSKILEDAGARRLVKSKSMLTEECGLNPFLESKGIEVVDTDLGERIVQLAGVPPSHIVMPAIHMKREEIGELFHEKIGTDRGAVDPVYLTGAARTHLRKKFLSGDAALTGVNFAVAETGGFVVVTNEGNADLGVHLAPVHIASMGIEKVIPRAADLGVFLRLLARSATGQPISVYSSHFHRPRTGQELHLVIVDNGRTDHLGRGEFWRGLKCIRCGACINTCPIYRRSGGHSYGSTIPGPIGSTLNPGVDLEQYASLPFASTLCGSCTEICPVKIDLHHQLYAWRQYATEGGKDGLAKRWLLKRFARTIARPRAYRFFGGIARLVLRVLPNRWAAPRWMPWTKTRDLPKAPKQSFLEWYRTSGSKRTGEG